MYYKYVWWNYLFIYIIASFIYSISGLKQSLLQLFSLVLFLSFPPWQSYFDFNRRSTYNFRSITHENICLVSSEGHWHWHGLAHLPKQKIENWKRQETPKKVLRFSRRNAFKKINCLDYISGVLRYLSCSPGQIKTWRDEDGLVSLPHTHCARKPISDYHRHSRGRECEEVRSGISRLLSKHIDFSKKENWTWFYLHGAKRFKSARGHISRKEIKDANEKDC